MTEKNTLSILESIKKKMQKFDQEPKKIETVSDVSDEFEYISSSKGKAPEQQSVREEKSAIDKELRAPVESIKSEPQSEVESKPEIKIEPKIVSAQDDLNLDDLGLDDEDPFDMKIESHDAVAAETIAPVNVEPQVAAEEIHEEDDEEVVEEAVVEEDDEEVVEEAVEEKESEIELPHDEDDLDLDLDLDFDLDEDQKEEVAVEEEEISEIDAPTPAAPLAPSLETKEAPKNVDLDDIDLDELLKEEEAVKQPAPQKPVEIATPTKTQKDLEEEEFLKDLDLDEELSSSSPQAPSEKKEVVEDDDFDDIDLDEPLETAPADLTPAEPEVSIDVDPIISDPVPEKVTNTAEQDSAKILRQETVAEATQSIRKLIDTNNVINDVRGFSQNHPIFTEIAMQILEPKLEAWLNEHLPQLVEKIVQEEIKKIMPRG